MEDHLHEDKLDDYVRKSFEAYEEDPAPDMWGRIEGDMPPAAPLRARRFSLWPYRWQAAAAALILVLTSTLLCEHLYFTERIKTLSEQLSTAPPAPAPRRDKGRHGARRAARRCRKAGGKKPPPLKPRPAAQAGWGKHRPPKP
ncbi:MAG TPA: hypothetical protein PKD78_01075 [Saprospiraceae bacterium]|nr:hypothetical protein [Saprospiraceae bacterium]